MPILTGTVGYIDVEQTVSDTALSLLDFDDLTEELVNRAQRMRLTVTAEAVRFFYGGETPTTTSGHLVEVDEELVLEINKNLQQFQVIRNGADDASIVVTLES